MGYGGGTGEERKNEQAGASEMQTRGRVCVCVRVCVWGGSSGRVRT